MCVPCKSGRLASLIARSSEFKRVSAPVFVQSTLESVQGRCHDKTSSGFHQQMKKWRSSLSCNLDFYIHIGPPFLQMLRVIFGFERPCGSKQIATNPLETPLLNHSETQKRGFGGILDL